MPTANIRRRLGWIAASRDINSAADRRGSSGIHSFYFCGCLFRTAGGLLASVIFNRARPAIRKATRASPEPDRVRPNRADVVDAPSRDPGDRLHCTNQNAARLPFRLRHEVEALVHPVWSGSGCCGGSIRSLSRPSARWPTRCRLLIPIFGALYEWLTNSDRRRNFPRPGPLIRRRRPPATALNAGFAAPKDIGVRYQSREAAPATPAGSSRSNMPSVSFGPRRRPSVRT